jgi:hypothetical protein
MSNKVTVMGASLTLVLATLPVLARAQELVPSSATESAAGIPPPLPDPAEVAPPPLPAIPLRPNQYQSASRVSSLVPAVPIVERWAKFTDPQEGAFSLDVPQNWKNSGGTVRRNALQFRNWVSAISPDGQTVIAINDSTEWSYIAPSPMLAATGFHVGSVYNTGGAWYTVSPVQSGEQFAVSWGRSRLAPVCSAVQVAGHRARPDLDQRISWFGIVHDVGEASFSCKRNDMDMSGYALASMTYLGSTGIWYSDTIQAFLAPEKEAGVAAGVLAHMVQSVELNLDWLRMVSDNAVAISRNAAQTHAAISHDIMTGWEKRGAIIDMVMDEGSRARLGIDFYKDPATGDGYTVDHQHNYYWVNASGKVMGTPTDTAPNGYRRLDRIPPGSR